MTFESQFFELTPFVGLALTGSATLAAGGGHCPRKGKTDETPVEVARTIVTIWD